MEDCPAGTVRVQTLYSGVSAGTELTAYRGSNVYLTKRWDADRRLFVPEQPSVAYPLIGWGYSEVGRVVEIGGGGDSTGSGTRPLSVGDVVHGVWGHRSEAVLPAGGDEVEDRPLQPRHVPAGCQRGRDSPDLGGDDTDAVVVELLAEVEPDGGTLVEARRDDPAAGLD